MATTSSTPDMTPHLARGLALASCGAALLMLSALLYVGAVRTFHGQLLDNAVFVEGQRFNDSLGPLAAGYRVGAPFAVAILCVVLAVLALRAGRLGDVARACIVVGVSVPVALWLKADGLERPALADLAYPYNTFPSGHVAAAAALCAAAIILWPRPRPTVVVVVAAVVVGAGVPRVGRGPRAPAERRPRLGAARDRGGVPCDGVDPAIASDLSPARGYDVKPADCRVAEHGVVRMRPITTVTSWSVPGTTARRQLQHRRRRPRPHEPGVKSAVREGRQRRLELGGEPRVRPDEHDMVETLVVEHGLEGDTVVPQRVDVDAPVPSPTSSAASNAPG